MTDNQKTYFSWHVAKKAMPAPTGIINLGGGLGHFINFELLPEDSIIIDGGVCVGEFVDRINQEVDTKNFKIIGFEPCKDNLRKLEGRPEKLRAEISDKALVGEGDAETVTFYEFSGLEEWGNIMGEDLPRGFHRRAPGSLEYEVQTTTLIKIFEEYNLPRIDYLKLDIEGPETSLVKTMSQETANKIFQISMEVHNGDGPQLKTILENLGYECIFERGELYGARKQIESGKDVK